MSDVAQKHGRHISKAASRQANGRAPSQAEVAGSIPAVGLSEEDRLRAELARLAADRSETSEKPHADT